MAVSPTYPGVYIDELPSAVRTIIGVPTAVAAFVGPALRGPVDKARHITSFADFERIYGGLSDTSLMSYAVFHYYLMGGAEAEIVRVASTTAPAVLDLGNGVKLNVKPPGKQGRQVRARVEHPNAADPTVYSIVIHPASGANETIADVKAGADANAPESLQSKLAGAACRVRCGRQDRSGTGCECRGGARRRPVRRSSSRATGHVHPGRWRRRRGGTRHPGPRWQREAGGEVSGYVGLQPACAGRLQHQASRSSRSRRSVQPHRA